MSHRIFDGMTINGHDIDTSILKDTGKVIVDEEKWSAEDLITEEDKLDIFNEDSLRTKEELLEDIDRLLTQIDADSKTDTRHSAAYYTRYTNLIRRFKEKIEESTFPKALEKWWHYIYEVEETGVTLTLEYVSIFDLDDEGNPDFIYVDTAFRLLHVDAALMTVEQYAQACGVTPTTVRQWIRRGKIRTAVKQGGEWRIPELAEVLDRGYQGIQYERTEYLSDLPEKYAFFNDYKFVSLCREKEHSGMYTALFSNEKGYQEILMDQTEREKFELYLISSPFVIPETNTITSRG